jgi:hypothetical protein
VATGIGRPCSDFGSLARSLCMKTNQTDKDTSVSRLRYSSGSLRRQRDQEIMSSFCEKDVRAEYSISKLHVH